MENKKVSNKIGSIKSKTIVLKIARVIVSMT